MNDLTSIHTNYPPFSHYDYVSFQVRQELFALDKIQDGAHVDYSDLFFLQRAGC